MRAALILAVPAVSATLCGCASTVDPRSGENLIRRVVASTPALGTLRSVKCPSGVAPKTGGVLNCQVRLAIGTRPVSGTVTVHVVGGKQLAVTGSRDLSTTLQQALSTQGR